MNILGEVDGDEVSLVKRAANKRRFLLLKGDSDLDPEISDLLEVPWEREGSLLDEVRKDGVDESTERAILVAVRLLKGVESDLTPETIAKLGSELYGRGNPDLNSSSVNSPTDLDGDGDTDEDLDGDCDGPDMDGSASGLDLDGSGSAPKVAADNDQDEDDMNKADFSSSDRKSLASRGKALPDGSYPIRNKSDLSNAIQAFGRAKDKGRAKAWIIRRARALGATSMLPDSWSVSKEDSDWVEAELDSEWENVEKTDDERGTVEVQVPIKKEDGTWDLSGVPEESRPFFEEMITKADKTAEELAETREQLQKSEDELLHRSMIEKASRYNHVAAVDDLTPVLKEASRRLDPETFGKLEDILGGAEDRIQKGDLFTEMGRTGTNDGKSSDDAYSQLVEKANEMVAKGDGMTSEQAFDRAMRENPALYERYMAEHGMGV